MDFPSFGSSVSFSADRNRLFVVASNWRGAYHNNFPDEFIFSAQVGMVEEGLTYRGAKSKMNEYLINFTVLLKGAAFNHILSLPIIACISGWCNKYMDSNLFAL